MNKTITIIVLILFSGSCALITEPDISGSDVVIISPPDGLETTVATLTLWWDYLSDAQGYNVLIVSPGWDSIVRLIADTNVSGNKFVVTLPPGEYDWGVSAYNNSSSTQYIISHISIDTASNLTGQEVVLKSPAENYMTNKEDISFSWYELAEANGYLFDLRFDSWLGDNVFPTISLTDLKYSLTIPEGVYVWGVKAINDNSWTQYKTRTLIVDQTPPGKPSITFPKYNNDTLRSDARYVAWSRSDTSTSPISDSVFISKDSTFLPGDFQYAITQETEINLSDFNVASGKYFVRIRSFDAAGNVGQVSSTRKFFIYEE